MPPAIPTAAAPTAAAGAAALLATDLTVSTTPLPLLLAVELVERLAVLPPARFDPFREALLVERVARVPLLVAAVLGLAVVLVPDDFFAGELFRLDDFAELLVLFALLFGLLPAISHSLLSRTGRRP